MAGSSSPNASSASGQDDDREAPGDGGGPRVETSGGNTGEIYMRVGNYVCPALHINNFTPLEFEEVTHSCFLCFGLVQTNTTVKQSHTTVHATGLYGSCLWAITSRPPLLYYCKFRQVSNLAEYRHQMSALLHPQEPRGRK